MMLIDTYLELTKRPRRNRKSPQIRSLVQENHLLSSNLIAPFFVINGKKTLQSIPSMPGIYRWTSDLLIEELKRLHKKGMQAVCIFPWVPGEIKDNEGSEALNEMGLIPETIRLIKKELPSLCVIADVALDPYTTHGHDGLIAANGMVHNDASVKTLCQMAKIYAQCGVDMVAPSDMMDGRVGAIRKTLDKEGYDDVSILAYTAKYASCLYAPFRDAIGSGVAFGDKKNYQMNPANIQEALLEAKLDEEEGADILLVKPALYYLDVIAKIKENTHLPVCAYHVSGEYAMVMAAEEKGYLDSKKVFAEALLSIKRAGANMIISYAAPLFFSESKESQM